MAEEDEGGFEEDVEFAEEEGVEPVDGADADERADLQKLLLQHPEIWIPFEDQVKEHLRVSGPSSTTPKGVVDEGTALSAISKDSEKGPGDPYHTTYPFLTEYEITKLLSLRARELDNGAHPYTKVPEGVTSSYVIAQRELEEKKLPYILKRPLPNGTYEYWSLLDLMILKEE